MEYVVDIVSPANEGVNGRDSVSGTDRVESGDFTISSFTGLGSP